MMDYQFWIYLIIAIIYIVSRALKKAEKQAPEVEDRRPARQADRERPASTERPKTLTFEELLREITEAKQPQKTSYQPVPSRTEYVETEVVDYDEQIEEEARDLREVDYEQRKRERRNDAYEEAKRMAFNRPSLEETMRLRDTQVQFEKFKEFEVEERPNLLDRYTREFRDREGLKKAVVLSEILKRKFEY